MAPVRPLCPGGDQVLGIRARASLCARGMAQPPQLNKQTSGCRNELWLMTCLMGRNSQEVGGQRRGGMFQLWPLQASVPSL